MTEPKYYQCYDLHMKNGKVLNYAEDYDIPAEKGLIGQFKRGKKRFLKNLVLYKKLREQKFSVPFVVILDFFTVAVFFSDCLNSFTWVKNCAD